jgi:hypothetical protein
VSPVRSRSAAGRSARTVLMRIRYRMPNRAELLGLPELLRGARCHTPDKPWRALRHTFAAHAVMSGIPLYTVKELLGHASIEMTQRYAHLAPDYLGREVARLNFVLPTDGKSYHCTPHDRINNARAPSPYRKHCSPRAGERQASPARYLPAPPPPARTRPESARSP